MLPRANRLRSPRDFKRVYKRGESIAGKSMVVYRLPGSTVRLGLSVSKKVGNAVIRNRTRRRLSEAFRNVAGTGTAGDYVIIARPAGKDSSFQNMETEMKKLLSGLEERSQGERS